MWQNHHYHSGFTIQKIKLTRLTSKSAELLYKAHKEQIYYASMCAFITSGPVVPMVLTKEKAIADFDSLKDAIRSQFSISRTSNMVHGADSIQAAYREASIFFADWFIS